MMTYMTLAIACGTDWAASVFLKPKDVSFLRPTTSTSHCLLGGDRRAEA